MNTNFNCSESELYSVCKIGWKSNGEYLAEFAALKAKYTATFNSDNTQKIKDAQVLPAVTARYAQSEKLRIKLVQINQELCDAFQKLKLYITDAYAPEYHKVNFNEAGQNFYEEAAAKNWDKSSDLAAAMDLYIDKHLSDLTAGQNMPSAFQATVTGLKTQFENQYQDFADATETAKVATQTKVEANNQLHENLMSMFKDGQQIFKRNQAVLDQFTFDTVLSLVTNTQASIKAQIQDKNTLLGLADAIISIIPSDTELTTDLNGEAHANIAAGTYTITITHPQYVTETIDNFDVKASQGNILKVKLTPL